MFYTGISVSITIVYRLLFKCFMHYFHNYRLYFFHAILLFIAMRSKLVVTHTHTHTLIVFAKLWAKKHI